MTLTPELIPLLNTTGLAAKDNRLYQVLQSLITNLSKAESNLVLVATTASTASTASSNAITALSGDVTAVGPGAVVSTLSTTGVVAGTYGSSSFIPIITVNNKGRVLTVTTTAVSTGGTTGITQLTGDVLAGPGTGSQASTLATTGVTAGTYGSASVIPIIVIDAKGRITSASTAAISTVAGSLIGFTAYAAGSDVALHTQSSNTMSDVDTTNATVTFTAPASGNILTKISALGDNSTTGDHYWGIRESTTTVATCFAFGQATQAVANRRSVAFYITGVSAGSHTYKFANRATAGTVHIYSGPNYGQVVIEVYSMA